MEFPQQMVLEQLDLRVQKRKNKSTHRPYTLHKN